MKKFRAFTALLLSVSTIAMTACGNTAEPVADPVEDAQIVTEVAETTEELITIDELIAEDSVSVSSLEELEVALDEYASDEVVEVKSVTYDAVPMAGFSVAVAGDAKTAYYGCGFAQIPATDDGNIYLYALNPYEYTIPAGATPIASAPIDATVLFNFPLNFGTVNTRLYQKFAAGVMVGGKLVMVASPKYITNPEVLATHTRPYSPIAKGNQQLHMWNFELNGTGNVSGVFLPVINILASTDPNNVTANAYARVADAHPIVHAGNMLNAYDQAGVNALATDCSSIAATGGQCFVIGNEVNQRIWNYMAFTDWNTYVTQYYQAFRVCYNAIKSQNANAKVMISLDHTWDVNRTPASKDYYDFIDAKDFCDIFNNLCVAEGNIDWGVSIHPYLYPLTYSKFWDMSGYSLGAYCKRRVDTNQFYTFQNMSVVTNYLAQPQFLNPAGQPRYFIINEIGVNNTQGDQIQAAALATLWVSYATNPYIHEMFYAPFAGYDVDPTFIGMGAQMWEAFGTPDEPAYLQWAMGYMGISDWSQVIR